MSETKNQTMSRIRGLELLFNLVKSQLKSKEDCVVAALHCLFINENVQCVGIGEEFSDNDASSRTELLPKGWNENQSVYTLRYMSKDAKERYLLKIVKAGSMLHVNVVLNEDTAVAMSANVIKMIGDDYSEYSNAYTELDTLSDSFKRDIADKLHGTSNPPTASNPKTPPVVSPSSDPGSRSVPDFSERPGGQSVYPDIGGRPAFPSVGGADLDPFGRGQGTMLIDPSSFGPPSRPFMPPFGGTGNLPRGAVPPGARFDPFGPPLRGPDRFNPSPDHYRPPDFDDFI